MFTVLLPPGGYPIAVNKYIIKRGYPDKVLLNSAAVSAVDRSQHLFIEVYSQLPASM
jgi:hypothetical protein